MKVYNLGEKIYCFRGRSVYDVEKNVNKVFDEFELPRRDARILLKPNLNNDLNSLTGNSTDLRVIVGVIKVLQKRGYKDIFIGDGPNCGINHIGIDVFSRLKIKEIGKRFNVEVVDFNKEEYVESGLGKIAKICLDNDFFINLPKVKTHIEVGVSIACKNLIGCFLGLEKRRIHNNLSLNIVRLNEIIKPDLCIVDGLIAMEGNGPGDGNPKKIGVVLIGKNPFLIDLLCGKLFGIEGKHLRVALGRGHLSKKDFEMLEDVEEIVKLKKAKQNFLSKILLKNFFVMPRYWKMFDWLFSKGFVPWLLYKLGVRQDVYVLEDDRIDEVFLKKGNFKKGMEYCPLGLKKPDEDCIKCMYCYFVDDVGFKGELGYLKMVEKRFGRYFSEL